MKGIFRVYRLPACAFFSTSRGALLRTCCACGHVHDEAGATPSLERWVSQRAYRKGHGVSPVELALTHTYCPPCFAQAQEVVERFFQTPQSET